MRIYYSYNYGTVIYHRPGAHLVLVPFDLLDGGVALQGDLGELVTLGLAHLVHLRLHQLEVGQHLLPVLGGRSYTSRTWGADHIPVGHGGQIIYQ